MAAIICLLTILPESDYRIVTPAEEEEKAPVVWLALNATLAYNGRRLRVYYWDGRLPLDKRLANRRVSDEHTWHTARPLLRLPGRWQDRDQRPLRTQSGGGWGVCRYRRTAV